jgi:hypothetical protein
MTPGASAQDRRNLDCIQQSLNHACYVDLDDHADDPELGQDAYGKGEQANAGNDHDQGTDAKARVMGHGECDRGDTEPAYAYRGCETAAQGLLERRKGRVPIEAGSSCECPRSLQQHEHYC